MTPTRVALCTLAAALATGTAATAPAATASTRPLTSGDGIFVKGTSIACFVLRSNGKDGIGCVPVDKTTRPVSGTYGVGIAVDGTTIINQVKADGTSKTILRRKPQAAARWSSRTYTAFPGDVFLLPIDPTHKLACRVTRVKPGQAAVLYQGVKIGCWRILRTGFPVPHSDAVQISDRMASIVRADAKGVFNRTVLVKKQPG